MSQHVIVMIIIIIIIIVVIIVNIRGCGMFLRRLGMNISVRMLMRYSKI